MENIITFNFNTYHFLNSQMFSWAFGTHYLLCTSQWKQVTNAQISFKELNAYITQKQPIMLIFTTHVSILYFYGYMDINYYVCNFYEECIYLKPISSILVIPCSKLVFDESAFYGIAHLPDF